MFENSCVRGPRRLALASVLLMGGLLLPTSSALAGDCGGVCCPAGDICSADGYGCEPGRGGGGWINNGITDTDLERLARVDTTLPLTSGGALTGASIDLATYLVECALDEAQAVSARVGSQSIVLRGRLGLASEWQTEACDRSCQQMVSACLLARTNRGSRSVLIHVIGADGLLGTEHSAGNTVPEATFFGNLFTYPQQRYVCEHPGADVAQALAHGRTCISRAHDYCGFTYLGQCRDIGCVRGVGDSFASCSVGGATYTTVSTATHQCQ